MKRSAVPWLVVLNLALLAGLAWLWLTPQGQLRNVRWDKPAPVNPVFTVGQPVPDWSVDIARFVATLDRPLFSPTRKPPPPPKPADTAPVDTLAEVTLVGIWGGADSGGVIARVGTRIERARVGQTLAGWTLKEVQPNAIALMRGDESRRLELRRAALDSSQPSPSAAAASATPSGRNAEAAAYEQRQTELARERVRAMNRVRARTGLPPLPEP